MLLCLHNLAKQLDSMKNDHSAHTIENLASEEAQGKILSHDKSILLDLYQLKLWQHKALSKAATLDKVERHLPLLHHKMRPRGQLLIS